MRSCLVRSGIVFCCLALPSPVWAQGKDLLELLPAQTLACLEVRQPERLAREVSALLKGSMLEDMAPVLARFRASMGNQRNFWMRESDVLFSLFLSPELISEAGRMQGAAVALTGFARDGTPEVIGVLQTGDSNLVGLYTRAYTMLAGPQIVAEVEGVPIFREKRQVFRPRVKGQDGPGVPPEETETGPAIVRLPGLVLIGSSVDVVKDVIRRFKGKNADPALASLAAYRNAEAVRNRPGFFGHVNIDALAAQIDEICKQHKGSASEWNMINALINPAAMLGLTGSLSLHNGALELRTELKLDPRHKSPLLELFPDKPVRLDMLRSTARETTLAVTLDLSDGEKRWDKLVKLLDAVAKVNGQEGDALPSRHLAELEEKLRMNIGKDVAGRITGAALVLATVVDKGVPRLEPSVVVQTASAEAARYLEETGLPVLLQLAGDVPKLEREEVDGVKLARLPSGGFLGKKRPLLAGRHGSMLVLGESPETVAALLKPAGETTGLSPEKIAAALKEADQPVVMGVASLSSLALRGFQIMGMYAVPDPNDFPRKLRPGEVPPPPQPATLKLPQLPSKTVEAFTKAAAGLPPLLLTLQRKPERVTLTIRQPSLRSASARLADLWVDATLARLREQYMGGQGMISDKMPAEKPVAVEKKPIGKEKPRDEKKIQEKRKD